MGFETAFKPLSSMPVLVPGNIVQLTHILIFKKIPQASASILVT